MVFSYSRLRLCSAAFSVLCEKDLFESDHIILTLKRNPGATANCLLRHEGSSRISDPCIQRVRLMVVELVTTRSPVMNTVSLSLLCLGIVLAGSGCSKRTVEVRDVTKPEVLVLRKTPSQGAIHRIRINGAATLDGEARVQLIQNGAVYKDQLVNGRSEFQWEGDWYTDQAEVRYIPASVSKGSVVLRYDFKD